MSHAAAAETPEIREAPTALILSPVVPRERAEAAEECARRAEATNAAAWREGADEMESACQSAFYGVAYAMDPGARRTLLRKLLTERVGPLLADTYERLTDDRDVVVALVEIFLVNAKERL
jgi:hypothetical protein